MDFDKVLVLLLDATKKHFQRVFDRFIDTPSSLDHDNLLPFLVDSRMPLCETLLEL